MIDRLMAAEIKARQEKTRQRLVKFIAEHKRPSWWPWYPAKSAVMACEAQLKAMDQIANDHE